MDVALAALRAPRTPRAPAEAARAACFLPRRSTSDQLRVSVRLRTTASAGLVLWTGRRREEDDAEVQAVHQRHGVHPSFGNDFLALAVQDGFVHLRLDLGSGELFLGYNLTRVDDGQWHRVVVARRGQEATISVDNGPGLGRTAPGRLRQLNTNTGLYVGGCRRSPARRGSCCPCLTPFVLLQAACWTR